MKIFKISHMASAASLSAVLFLSALPVYAAVPASLKEYTVWNQFDATVNTFQKLGLIMSDARYQTLFFGIIVLGIVIGGIVTIGTGIFSGKTSSWDMMKWFGIIMTGIIVYITFIRPTTQITIYDEVLNETQTVGGVPEGIVVLAGLSNAIEKGFVDMIWTAGTPKSYRDNAGALSYSIFDKAFSGGVDLSGSDASGQYMNMSLRRYVEDCVFFEVTKPGSSIDINSLDTTSDFRPVLASAVNPAIYTVWYDSANRSGATLTCTQAWSNLSNYLNGLSDTNPAVNKFWQERCGETGLGVNSALAGGSNLTTICRQKAVNMASAIFGSSFSSGHLFRQYLIASALWDVYTTYSPDSAIAALSNRATGNSMMGMGIMANEWIPIIRSVVFSIFIGMIPFICTLIPTPLFPRAMGLLFGIFVFLTSWTICDALVHSFAMDKTFDLFQEITNGSLGFKSMMLFSSSSQKAMAAFGAARWSAIMVAGVFSALLTKFGGSAMAHFAGNLSAFKQYGAGAAESAMNPPKWASDVHGLTEVAPSMVYANAGVGSAWTSKTYDTSSKINTSLGAVGAFGDGNPLVAGSTTAKSNVTGLKEKVSHAESIGAYAKDHGMDENQVIRAVENFQTASQGGSAQALQNLSNDLKSSPFEAMDLIKDTGLKKEYGNLEGLRNGYDNAVQQNGYTGAFSNYIAMQSELQSDRGFADVKATDKFSANYNNGRAAFLKDQAEFKTGETAGLLENLKEHRLNPGNVGEVLGSLHGAQSMADSSVYQDVGNGGVMITRAGEQYNELSKMLTRQAVDDIVNTGGLQNDTQQAIKGLMSNRSARAQMRTQGIGNFTVSSDAAPGLGKYLRENGVNVKDSELENATAQLNFAPNQNGTLSPSLLMTSKGKKLAEFDMSEKDFRSVQRGQEPGSSGNTFGGVQLESVTNKTDFGGVLEVSGYDRAGNMRRLFVSNSSGKVIEDDVSKGPDFGKANVISMVGQHSLPGEVFSDPGYAIAFANRFASQWGKEYNGSIRRSNSTQITTQVGGRFNLGFGKSGSGGGFDVGGNRQDLNNSGTVAQRDVIYGITKDILTRDNWTPEEKSTRLEKLNGALLQGDFFNPDSLPSKVDMMNAGDLDRQQTPLSGKFQTKGEREKNQESLNRHPENQPILFRPVDLQNDDT
ncbi:MAG: conjugal transfer protein TraG N-terminal domain-containing protein [Desulfosalsimonadaceae bacterium]